MIFSCTRPSEEELLLVQMIIFHEEKSLNPFYSHSIKFGGHKKLGYEYRQAHRRRKV